MTRNASALSLALILASGLLSSGTAQDTSGRDLAVNQVAMDSINREAQKYTGHVCQGHYRVMDMIGNARGAHLKFAHDTLLQIAKSRLGSRADQLVKSDFVPGQMGRIYADLSSMNLPSAFMMDALQPYQGKNHVIAYQCWLK